jgi:uncharacterized protein (DUF2235 family)
MQKVVYIVPALKESPNAEIYKKVGRLFNRARIKPIFVRINWGAKNNLMQDYLNQFIKTYKKVNVKDDEVYIFGFSAGAWIAFMASLEIKPKKVFLCSLSPYFKEDMKFWKKAWIDGIGKKRFNYVKNHKFSGLVRRFRSKAIIFVGKNEEGVMIRRSRIAHESIKNSKLAMISNGIHDIRQKEYIATLKKYIK